MKKITVLYVCTDVDFAGSSKSLFYMIKSLSGYIDPIVLLSSKGEVYYHYTNVGIKCIIHPFFYLLEKSQSKKNLLKNPLKSRYYQYWKKDRDCVKYVKAYLSDVHVDIIHSNTSIVTIGVDLAKALNSKHVWHIREYLDLDFNITVFRGHKRLKKLIDCSDARVVVSDSVKRHWNFNEEGTYVIWNAVRYQNDACVVVPKDKYFLFSATYFSENKGVSFAIRSFARSGLMKYGYKLKMLGNCDDDYKSELKKIITTYDLQEFVEFLGYQTNVKDFYTRATAYLMTSKSEAMGRVTVEAMFYGCPIIAHATGGTPEFIKHGYNGFLFSNEEECAFYMQKIVIGEGVQEMIQNAKLDACEKFSVEVYGEKILRVYKSLVNIQQ